MFRQSGKGRPDYRFKQKSSDDFLCVFVPYRYSDSGNLTAGRCPGSKALVFYRFSASRVTVPNVNIGDCDYTIACWIRLFPPDQVVVISGSLRSGKFRTWFISTRSLLACSQALTGFLPTLRCLQQVNPDMSPRSNRKKQHLGSGQ